MIYGDNTVAAPTIEETNAMKRLMEMMEGKTPSAPAHSTSVSKTTEQQIELSGPGQITSSDINAMADVLSKLNNVTQQVLYEGDTDHKFKQDVSTVRNDRGVKVGNYQIMIKEDTKRLAGKQYYSIYHVKTEDVIADDLTLYETALNVVKMLNSGKYVNDPVIRKLFEADDNYTSQRTDAIRFKYRMRKAEQEGDYAKLDVYESRYQTSISNAMNHKKTIKNLIEGRY